MVANKLPFLEVSFPNDQQWLKFSELGVIKTETLELYIRQLKAMATLSFGASKSQVGEIYAQIAARSSSTSQRSSVWQVNRSHSPCCIS